MIGKSGSAVERLRKSISLLVCGVLLLVALLTVPVDFEDGLHETLEITGYLLLIIAGLGRIWCSIYIAGRKNKVLCTEGPYSICRNPLYFFSFLGVVGAFLALQSVLLTLIASILYLAYYHFVIESEERRLAALFGDSFSDYLKSTSRFLPSCSSYQSGATERMVSTRLMEKGLKEVLWFFVAIVFIDGIELVHSHGYLILCRLPF